MEEIESFEWPDIDADYRYEGLREKISLYKEQGYAVMGEMGMKATEEFLPDAEKKGTMIGSTWAIDFCFVDTKYWKGTGYKVITDHQYSETASDHYPVFTEIERI